MSAVKFIMLNVKAYWRRRADDPEADRRPGEEAFSRLFCNATAAFWEKLGPPIADNYNVRWALGMGGGGEKKSGHRCVSRRCQVVGEVACEARHRSALLGRPRGAPLLYVRLLALPASAARSH